MWWRRQRNGARVSGMLRTGGRGRVRTMRLHAVTGTLVAVGMIFLTVTGLTWSSVAGTNIGEARSQLNWTAPSVSAAGAHAGHGGHGAVSAGPTGSVDEVSATAQAELRVPVTITPPEEGQTWTAAEDRQAYRLSNDAVAIDGTTGEVTDRVDFADWPLAAKASDWLIQLHMGTLFGLPNQIVLGLLAAAIIAMVCWGYAMWWQRRPARGAPRAGRGVSGGTLVLVAVLTVYGVVAPLFGVTCLVFIAGSALWSAVADRRQGAGRERHGNSYR